MASLVWPMCGTVGQVRSLPPLLVPSSRTLPRKLTPHLRAAAAAAAAAAVAAISQPALVHEDSLMLACDTSLWGDEITEDMTELPDCRTGFGGSRKICDTPATGCPGCELLIKTNGCR